jgi:hypothetical protein
VIEGLIAEAIRVERARPTASVTRPSNAHVVRRPRAPDVRRRVGLALVRCGARIAGIHIAPHPG